MPSKLWTIGIPIISALIAILFAAIPLALAGANIFEAYSQMAKGIFGSTFAFTEMFHFLVKANVDPNIPFAICKYF